MGCLDDSWSQISPCSLVKFAFYFNYVCSWFPARLREVKDPAEFPDVLERVSDLHWLVAAEGLFITSLLPLIETCLLCLFPLIGFSVMIFDRIL